MVAPSPAAEVKIDPGPLAPAQPAKAAATPPPEQAPISSPVGEQAAASPTGATPASPAPATPVAAQPPTAPPPIAPEVRQYITRLEQQQAEAQEQRDRQLLAADTAEKQKRLEEYGLTPAQAKEFADTYAAAIWGQFQWAKQAQAQVAEERAKALVASRIAEEFKVPIAELLTHATPQAMQRAAEEKAGKDKQSERIAALEAEIAAMKKAQVPAGQKFDSGVGVPKSPSNYLELLKTGKPLPPSQEIDREIARLMRG